MNYRCWCLMEKAFGWRKLTLLATGSIKSTRLRLYVTTPKGCHLQNKFSVKVGNLAQPA